MTEKNLSADEDATESATAQDTFWSYAFQIGVINPLSALWYGFATSVLWGWFVVPTFGVPALPLVSAAGIVLLIMLLVQPFPPTLDKNSSLGHTIQWRVMKPAVALLVGYGFSFFV